MERENWHYEFSAEKNQQLINERGISFDEVVAAIEEGALLDIVPHPNPAKFPNQEIYILNINSYVYLVPFVRKDKNTVFLKTIFPHRKLTKQYLKVKEGD
ncbi:MAG: toxin [Coxiella sp. RIFCSPHIGHO2_12_FULL_42_15]|nr:MAG: toxin [Coxiella sp. RIFCSPHIGHO2_12_FULL_42_15]